MSAMKDFALQLASHMDQVDLEMHELQFSLQRLINECWSDNDDSPTAAPDMEWIEETQTQLQFCMHQLLELQQARDSVDA